MMSICGFNNIPVYQPSTSLNSEQALIAASPAILTVPPLPVPVASSTGRYNLSVMQNRTYFWLYSHFLGMRELGVMERVSRFFRDHLRNIEPIFWRRLISQDIRRYIVGNLDNAPVRVLRQWAKRSFMYQKNLNWWCNLKAQNPSWEEIGQQLARYASGYFPCLQCPIGRVDLNHLTLYNTEPMSPRYLEMANPTFLCTKCLFNNTWSMKEAETIWGFTPSQLQSKCPRREQLQERIKKLTAEGRHQVHEHNYDKNGVYWGGSSLPSKEMIELEIQLGERSDFHAFGFTGKDPHGYPPNKILFLTEDLVELRRKIPYKKRERVVKPKEFEKIMERWAHLPKAVSSVIEINCDLRKLTWIQATTKRKKTAKTRATTSSGVTAVAVAKVKAKAKTKVKAKATPKKKMKIS